MLVLKFMSRDKHIVRCSSIGDAFECSSAQLVRFGCAIDVGFSHCLNEYLLPARETQDAAEGRCDVRVHWANRANWAKGCWNPRVPNGQKASQTTFNHFVEHDVGAVECKGNMPKGWRSNGVEGFGEKMLSFREDLK